MGDEDGRRAALMAADQLMEQFQPIGQFIQAWGRQDNPSIHYAIDCLLKTCRCFIGQAGNGPGRLSHRRPCPCPHHARSLCPAGRSTYHTFYMDPETGAPVRRRDEARLQRQEAAGARTGLEMILPAWPFSYRYDDFPPIMKTFERLLAALLSEAPA